MDAKEIAGGIFENETDALAFTSKAIIRTAKFILNNVNQDDDLFAEWARTAKNLREAFLSEGFNMADSVKLTIATINSVPPQGSKS